MVDVDELELEALDGPSAGDVADDDADRVDEAEPFEDGGDFLTDDGDRLPDEVQAELEALAAAELDDGTGLEAALAEAQRELARQRNLTRQAVARYRDALLAAEPELPPDLVRGESLEEIEESAASAREAVRRIRERIAAERPRGFPVGAPARSSGRAAVRTPHEKIAAGLQERLV